MKVVYSLVVLVGVVLFVAFSSSQNVTSSVDVSNSVPVLILTIPNFTWAVNENFVNAFDLNDHFIDYNGDNMTFNVTNNSQILVVINQTTGNVSFYPTFGFSGTEVVTFWASDYAGNASSNRVFLNVGTDSESPQWYNMSNHSNVAQNDIVAFSTYWTDNVQLWYFVFSISQNGVWTNYSSSDDVSTNISGTGNFSNYSLQISAAPESQVHWKIYAFDTTGNSNVTDTQTFTLNALDTSDDSSTNTGGTSSGSGEGTGSSSSRSSTIIGRISSSFFRSVGLATEPYDFIIDVGAFNLELLQGDTRSIFFNVKNIGENNMSFDTLLEGINDIAFLNNKEFDVSTGESKEILIEIEIPQNYPPGQYFGIVKVIGNEGIEKTVPIAILVKKFDPALDLEVTVDEGSQLVKPGKDVSFTVDVLQPEYEKDVTVTLYTALKDYYGKIYDSKEREVTVGVKTSLPETLRVPEDSREGDYLVYSRVEYNNRSALDSDTFLVGYRFQFASFLKITGTFFYIFILAIVFALLALNYERKKKKEKLLNLYLLLSQMKDKLRKNELNAAAEIYIRIKLLYGQKVPTDLVTDKEFLKKELARLSQAIDSSQLLKEKQEALENAEQNSEGGDESQKGDVKDSEEKSADSGTTEKTPASSEAESDKAPEKKDEDGSEMPDVAKEPTSAEEPKPTPEQSQKPVAKPVLASQAPKPAPPVEQKKVAAGKPVVKKVVKKIIKKSVPVLNKNLKDGTS